MNFKQFFKEAYQEGTVTLHGEYWFDEHGDIMYADGDIGDMNHESYVIERCTREVHEFFSSMDDNDERVGDLSNYDEYLVDILIEDLQISDALTIEKIKNDPAQAIIHYLVSRQGMTDMEASDLVLTAYGNGDPRKYAVEKWNWKRVHRDAIESKKLTSDDLKIIARGINAALSDEGVWDDEETTTEMIDNHVYTIATYTGNRYNITLGAMERGEVENLERADIEHKNTAAREQLRKADIDAMPDYYKRKGIIGDSVEYR